MGRFWWANCRLPISQGRAPRQLFEVLVIANVMRRSNQDESGLITTGAAGRKRFIHYASHFVTLSVQVVSYGVDAGPRHFLARVVLFGHRDLLSDWLPQKVRPALRRKVHSADLRELCNRRASATLFIVAVSRLSGAVDA